MQAGRGWQPSGDSKGAAWVYVRARPARRALSYHDPQHRRRGRVPDCRSRHRHPGGDGGNTRAVRRRARDRRLRANAIPARASWARRPAAPTSSDRVGGLASHDGLDRSIEPEVPLHRGRRGALLLVLGFLTLPQSKVDVFPEFAPPKVEIQTSRLGLSSTRGGGAGHGSAGAGAQRRARPRRRSAPSRCRSSRRSC